MSHIQSVCLNPHGPQKSLPQPPRPREMAVRRNSSSTPNSKRVQLLENGEQFASAISAFAASPLASAVTSKVDSVSLTSATEAKVKYNLSAMGQTVANGATGTSVLQDGTWKVGDEVFCGLLNEAKGAGLTIPVPAACSSAT